jgi:hypothetical protein
MAKYIDFEKLRKELFKRTEKYADNVKAIYDDVLLKVIEMIKQTELIEGKPFSFAGYGYGDEATKMFKNMYSRLYQEIRGDIENEWILSNENNDELVKGLFGEFSVRNNHFSQMFERNMEAMNAFFARKTGYGLNLSQRVWNCTTPYMTELENCLDLALGQGIGANRLATTVKKYLKEPDMWYRRFRVKTGEDENGNTVYGRQWKRRIYDEETKSFKWIDDNPKNYNPGQGVYRSSYRNAQRLARTETNMAYRSADYERWQQLDFVVGIEIRLSNNHPVTDICDDLKGVYPKTFKWTGWHPQCRCFQVPVMSTGDEMDAMIDKILSGETDNVESVNAVKEYPAQFNEWLKDNQERMERAKSLPYFIRDNKEDVNKILKGYGKK